MRLIECGTKELDRKNDKEAHLFFRSAFDLYSLFFAINLKMLKVPEMKEASIEMKENEASEEKEGYFSKFREVVKKIVDCCKE